MKVYLNSGLTIEGELVSQDDSELVITSTDGSSEITIYSPLQTVKMLESSKFQEGTHYLKVFFHDSTMMEGKLLSWEAGLIQMTTEVSLFQIINPEKNVLMVKRKLIDENEIHMDETEIPPEKIYPEELPLESKETGEMRLRSLIELKKLRNTAEQEVFSDVLKGNKVIATKPISYQSPFLEIDDHEE